MNTSKNPRQPRTLRLGTRASLLAVAQSQQVADRLMQAHPGLQVQLIKMQSRGDRDLKTPLTDVAGNNFFSDQLDTALAEGHVDFCVHSWKDIDGPRPDKFLRAAVPTRALPHDVVLFRSDIEKKLRSGQTLRIGTCSKRRQINTADFLTWALPACERPSPGASSCNTGQSIEFSSHNLSFHNLRGPVHERVARISAQAGAQQLDGVVLALAGLERLWNDPAGRAAIESVLTDARWMVMPLSECPAAAAQGALAVETLRSNQPCIELLKVLHDPQTEQLVRMEHHMLVDAADNRRGFGASAVSHPALGFVARLRGRRSTTAPPVYATQTGNLKPTPPDPALKPARAWKGQSWRNGTRKQSLPHAKIETEAVFFAHADAYSIGSVSNHMRCWTSGPESWAKLAQQGLWVEGCADNLGFDSVKALLETPVLQLPELGHWAAVTHDQALESWSDSGVGTVIAAYAIQIDINPHDAASELQQCTHFFWSSARQYTLLKEHLPPNAQHACGAGKTYRALREVGLTDVHAFASRREWQQWLA